MKFRCVSELPPALRALLTVSSLLLALFVSWPPSDLLAQSSSETLDPRVQKLYNDVKAAEATGDLAQAAAKYESMLQLAPRLGAAYNNLGSIYLRQREFRKAADVLEKGLRVDPKMPSASALLGIALYELGEYGEARPRLEAALRANPKDDNAELMLANDLIKLGELEPAAGHLQQLARRQPKNQEVWYLLGKVYMQLSEQTLGKLNEIDPDSVLVHEISGEIMESMHNYDGALIEYKKAVEMAPERAGTHFRLGNAYWQLSMWDAATQQFQAELANDPRNCEAQWKIGNIRLEQHMEPETALAEVEKALAMCPNLASAHVDRARALLKLNRNEEAAKDLQIAEQADPSEPSTHFLLAQAYRALGRAKEAQAEMQLFSKLEESARAKIAERAKRLLEEKSSAPPER